MKLPLELRGNGTYKKLNIGVDLPSYFVDGIRAIDPDLHFIWHPFKILYNDITNQYTGSEEDARYTVGTQPQYGNQLLFGFVMTDGKSKPLLDNAWHCWRLSRPHGWAHVFRVEHSSEEYYKFALDRFYLQAKLLDRYGALGWSHYLREEQELMQAHKIKNMGSMFEDVTKENRWLLRSAFENFQNKRVSATKPTKDIITSFSGQKSHDRITRGLTDREGGLVLPDGYGD